MSQTRPSQHLVQMANDIGDFFRAQPDREEAVAGIANHIRSYWTRRMRDRLLTQLKSDDSALDELPREALRRLVEEPEKPFQPVGGDAG